MSVELLKQNMLVPYYLMSSYLYYHKDENKISDEDFDKICIRLKTEWKDITHTHKRLIKRKDLEAGTCFLKESKFPMMVKNSAFTWLEEDYIFHPESLEDESLDSMFI